MPEPSSIRALDEGSRKRAGHCLRRTQSHDPERDSEKDPTELCTASSDASFIPLGCDYVHIQHRGQRPQDGVHGPSAKEYDRACDDSPQVALMFMANESCDDDDVGIVA